MISGAPERPLTCAGPRSDTGRVALIAAAETDLRAAAALRTAAVLRACTACGVDDTCDFFAEDFALAAPRGFPRAMLLFAGVRALPVSCILGMASSSMRV